MKNWQRGYELEYLKVVTNKFSAFNEFSCSPFSEMTKNLVASALKNGHIEFLDRAVVETHIINVRREITADGYVVIGKKEKGDRIVKKISGNVEPLITRLKSYTEPTWLFIWEEDPKARCIAKTAGYEKIGVKVTSFGEIYGVYFKDNVIVESWFGLREHPKVPEYEKLAITKLRLEKTYPVETALTGIKDKMETLPEFTNHYSNYNSKGSWSALSLRGYRPDPTFITKPIEMNKKWKAENTGCLEWEIEDTPLRKDFPEIETLMDLLPGEKHRIRLMKLKSGGGELKRHTDLVDPDQGLSDGKLARIHIPVVTNKDVIFNNWDWDGNAPDVKMQFGEAWYLDVRKPHRALNGGTDDRIHIVVDVVSNEELRNLL